MRVRVARPGERPALIELQRRASLANEGDRAALEAHPEAVDTPAEQFAREQVDVVERDGVVIGFSAVIPRDDGDVELDALFVEPSAWRSGAGRALIDAACERARAAGARVIHVVGNPHADGFYRGVGFVPGEEVATRFGGARRYRLAVGPPSAVARPTASA